MGEFIGLQAINLLLIVVTLGVYRFWAKTRVRDYLWSRTRIFGEFLEYTGTGLELFLGFLIVLFVLILPLSLISMAMQYLAADNLVLLISLFTFLYLGLLYLFGVAIYRAQRYRFSRTRWRGIRGGMSEKGWRYGLISLGAMLFNLVSFGFAYPYTSTRLWKYRLSRSSFGTIPLESSPSATPVYKGFFMALGIWFVACFLFMAVFVALGLILVAANAQAQSQIPALDIGTGLFFYVSIAVLYVAGMAALSAYYRHFFCEILGSLRWGATGFRITAGTKDWLKFLLGNLLIVVVTLGLGMLVIPFRVFSFIGRHVETIGAPDPERLEQSRQSMPEQGEGLAEAFDIGGI